MKPERCALSTAIQHVETPAFIVDSGQLRRRVAKWRQSVKAGKGRVLYSVKSLPLTSAVAAVSNIVDGLSVSSLFEAKLAREFADSDALVGFVSPVLREREVDALANLCERVSLNSFQQLNRFGSALKGKCELGLRINPGLSFVGDERYDPCRRHTKLGVGLTELQSRLSNSSDEFSHVSGIHFHSNCDSTSIAELAETIGRIESLLGDDLRRFHWLNVGGGYIDEDADSVATVFERLRNSYGIEVVVEPGAAISRTSGFMISSVADLFDSDGTTIALLDTTVNHWPEVFEFQFEPDVRGHVANGRFQYQLAGCSCLAGDIFGLYSFEAPLTIGSRIVFENAGAYSIVKAHMFNGINLPTIYTLTESGELVMTKRFTYEDFASRCGVETRATI